MTGNAERDMLLTAGDVAAEGMLGLVGTYRETGGELKGSGLFRVSALAEWTGGLMTGAGITHVDGVLAISSDNGKELSRILENGGVGTWTGAGIGGSNGTINNLATASFSGAGNFTGNLINSGQLFPGFAGNAGVISLGLSFQQSASGTLSIDLGGPGSGSDMIAAGTVSLNGALGVNTMAGFDGNSSYMIVSNGGPSHPGTFAGLPELAVLMLNGYKYHITYVGGDGNDVVLKNTPPTATANQYTVDNDAILTGNVMTDNTGAGVDSDPDDAITVIKVNGVSTSVGVPVMLAAGGSVTVNSNGSFTYDPADNYVGVESFTYTIWDGYYQGLHEATANVTINVLGKIGGTVWRDHNANGIQDDANPAAPSVTVTITGPGGYSASTTTTGSYQFAHLATGTYTVAVTVPQYYHLSPTDQGTDDTIDSDGGSISVTLTANKFDLGTGLVNQPPILNTIGNRSLNEGSTLSFTVTATDPDSDPISFSMDPITAMHVIASINSNTGQFSFWADDGPASYNVTVRVTDVLGQIDSETFTVTVVNVAPTATFHAPSPPIDPMTGQPGSGPVWAWFTDQQDPSTANDFLAGFSYFWDYNEDGDFADPGEGPAGSSTTFTFSPGTHTVSGRIQDKDGGYTDYSAQVTVGGGSPLILSASGEFPSIQPSLIEVELKPIVAEAVNRWIGAGNLEIQTQIEQIQVHIADLPGMLLGLTFGQTIWIDLNAAGYGWFVDATPAEDSEFGVLAGGDELDASPTSPAHGRVDLLTVVIHEMGHALGYDHGDEHGAMGETLDLGTRHPHGCSCAACTASLPLANTTHPVAHSSLLDLANAIDEQQPSTLYALDWLPTPLPIVGPDNTQSAYAWPLVDVDLDLAEPMLSGDGDAVLLGGSGVELVIGLPGKLVLVGGFDEGQQRS